MAYFLNGIGVEVSPQAVRPREPARPSVARTTASVEMAVRALRPREATAVVPGHAAKTVVAARLKEVAVAKSKQKQAEASLQQQGAALALAKNALAKANYSGSLPATAAAQAHVASVGKSIDMTIACAKSHAMAANNAAGGAINAGASREDVKAAASVGSNSALTSATLGVVNKSFLQASIEANPHPQVFAEQSFVDTSSPAASAWAAAAARAATAKTLAIESKTASITPDGAITPGPGATVVDTPTQSDPSKLIKPADVTVSSGSLGTLAVVGVLGFLGWRWMKKSGKA